MRNFLIQIETNLNNYILFHNGALNILGEKS